MKAPNFTTKRALIDKANSTTVIAAGIAAFLVVFSVVSAKAFIGQIAYQNKVISAKKQTLETLKDNLKARDSIVKSYNAFAGTSQNLIGGNTAGDDDKDGDNAKIILDALPSKYDFPALTSSLEKLATEQGLKMNKITGTDDEVAQAAQQTSAAPKSVPMAFDITVMGDPLQLRSFVEQLEKSIRPFQIQKFSIESSDDGLQETVTAQTFYQPEKILELKKEVLMSNGKTKAAEPTASTPAATTGTSGTTGTNGTTTGAQQ